MISLGAEIIRDAPEGTARQLLIKFLKLLSLGQFCYSSPQMLDIEHRTVYLVWEA